ncbi:hypothetical protein SNOG_05071 [Parastagonospora nodorum SN15]|uniref:Uncharacterized protein n=1 Tax=Phaeosphaeria nodorum (strain SN15 / ATCC MYA-4574 / FGSC 10173) TaxID=321614 RepID=Q0UT43_PHANO|nr:hypothetical protein SNOG_05071 [Parastagonospora nodorum SN15]EAT87462.1 hypothetical protein SNOG_05071 [Parastagonospora nodorum SN15]
MTRTEIPPQHAMVSRSTGTAGYRGRRRAWCGGHCVRIKA